MLAEASATDISKAEKPQDFEEKRSAVQRGGSVAGVARQALERKTGKPVVTADRAEDFRRLVSDIIEDAAALSEAGKDGSETR